MVFALAGAVLWLGLACAGALGGWGLGIPELALLLSALVVVPLGLEHHASTRWLIVARTLQPACAVVLGVAFALEPGLPAAVLTAPWALVCGLVALSAGWSWLGRARSGRWLEGWYELASGAFLTIGSAWLAASRAGLAPMGFHEPIVLLTAVHFHYTGFVAPLLTGWAADRLGGRALHAAAVGTVAGTPLLAMGFTFSPALQTGAALLLSASLLLHGAGVLARRSSLAPRRGGGLLGVSAVAVLASMTLAVVYALGERTGQWWLTIPQMAASHGVLNALGFSLCGLTAWTVHRAGPFWVRRPSVDAGWLEGQAESARLIRGWPNGERARLGEGAALFARAVKAVERWQMLPAGIRVEPAAAISPGARLAVVARFGVWVAAPSVIVDVQRDVRRFSFLYRTLSAHPLRGEERFTVEHLADDSVWYEVTSTSALEHPAVWWAAPWVRWTQRWFARESARAIRAAVETPR
jgi:uncharacterized protein (UPF0548 family)